MLSCTWRDMRDVTVTLLVCHPSVVSKIILPHALVISLEFRTPTRSLVNFQGSPDDCGEFIFASTSNMICMHMSSDGTRVQKKPFFGFALKGCYMLLDFLAGHDLLGLFFCQFL